jgi:hypothetical protein
MLQVTRVQPVTTDAATVTILDKNGIDARRSDMSRKQDAQWIMDNKNRYVQWTLSGFPECGLGDECRKQYITAIDVIRSKNWFSSSKEEQLLGRDVIFRDQTDDWDDVETGVPEILADSKYLEY